MINPDKIKEELNLKPFGAKGWWGNKNLKCLKCGRGDKLGIKFTDKGGVVHCFYEIGEGVSIYKYLREIGRDDLILTEPKIRKAEFKIEDLKKEKELDLELPEKKLPRGFKRIYFDGYLDDRGFEPHQYNQFNIGISTDYLLKGYLVFLLKQEDKVVGWVARSKMEKEWHEENLKKFKEGEEGLVLRYRNSKNTDFNKILGGFDEITENTEEIWIVEGIFDKSNLDNIYGLNSQEKIKCCFTFGNRVTDHHLRLLKKKTNVKKIIMLYDFGTTKQTKKHSLQLSKNFEVMIGEFKDENVDAGNADREYMDEIFLNVKNYFYFYKNRI
jgi:hypothetical protein